jgi:uncharacterized membrane protein YvbJ
MKYCTECGQRLMESKYCTGCGKENNNYMEKSVNKNKDNSIIVVLYIFLGFILLFLLSNLGYLPARFWNLWPIILIVGGVVVIIKLFK